MKFGDWNFACGAIRSHGLDRGVERAHGHCHVTGMRGDARVADANHRELAADAADRAAAAARIAFVAGHVGVVEVGTARALQEIARGRCLVAKLTRCACEQRAREQRIFAAHAFAAARSVLRTSARS
jgi:hypothetical protein